MFFNTIYRQNKTFILLIDSELKKKKTKKLVCLISLYYQYLHFCIKENAFCIHNVIQ